MAQSSAAMLNTKSHETPLNRSEGGNKHTMRTMIEYHQQLGSLLQQFFDGKL